MYEINSKEGLLNPVEQTYDSAKIDSAISFFHTPAKETLKLPLLDTIVDAVKKENSLPDLSNTMFIGVQHILVTNIPFFDALIELGAKPTNMYFSGKCYSSSRSAEEKLQKRGIHLMPTIKPKKPGEYEEYCQEGIQKMWDFFGADIKQKKVDKIIVVDEGGRCLENMPPYISLDYPVAAIEQTRGGLYSELIKFITFPLIDVASCIAKKMLESPLIAKAIVKKLDSFLQELKPDRNETAFGIVGNGAIGNAVCQYLLGEGYKVVVYDEEESAFENIIDKNFYRLDSVEKVIVNTDIILGCTGKDITNGIDVLGIVKKDKVFISCTSEDKEFRSLLRIIASQNLIPIDPLSDISYLTKNGRKILILRGGFPFNFDKTPSSVPALDIQLTRGLMLVACLQAITSATKMIKDGVTVNKQGGRICLDPMGQSFVASQWIELQLKDPIKTKFKNSFESSEWIQKNSGGQFQKNDFLARCFSVEKTSSDALIKPAAKL